MPACWRNLGCVRKVRGDSLAVLTRHLTAREAVKIACEQNKRTKHTDGGHTVYGEFRRSCTHTSDQVYLSKQFFHHVCSSRLYQIRTAVV